MANSKKHFLFNFEWAEVLSEYSAEVRLEVYDAIIWYAQSGTLSELKPQAKMAFSFIKKEIDYNNGQYESKINARKEAGSKGGKAKQDKQTVAKQANATFAKQGQANGSIYDNVNDNDIILPIDKSIGLSGAEAPGEPISKEHSKKSFKPEISYQDLIRFFNNQLDSENSTIPRIQAIRGKRQDAVNARCKDYGKEAIFEAIVLASKSEFLNGKNSKSWIANFDWIFLPNNFPKVLEGNYNNANQSNYQPNRAQPSGLRSKLPPEPGYGLIED